MSAGGPGGWIPLPEPLSSRDGNLEPFDWFRTQRSAHDLRWDPERECWDVFTYEAVEQVLSDAETFANEPIMGQNTTFKDTLLALDPPEHTEKRSLVEEHFSYEAVQRYEDDIRASADRLLEDAMDGQSGQFDLVSSFAYPLPISTIAGILGASEDVRERLKAVSDEAVAAPDLSEFDDADQFVEDQAEAVFGIGQLVNDVILEKREDPGDDLVSDLAGSDHGLSHYELLRLCGLLMVAGHVTTTNLIGNTVRCLAARPDALEAVKGAIGDGDEEPIHRTVEEVLRYRSPVQLAVRVATEDTAVAGRSISEGEPVVAWIQAANRDPAVFDDPDTFDHTRAPNPNIAFGRGPHTCLGAHLAKLEGRVTTKVLFQRVESLEVIDTTHEPVEAPFLHGVRELPVRYECATGRADTS
ncbi:cytochrome P450 [Natrinema caseinilyticum]|uniref:cytochrome P450 n=1 Tax=Natrinema caseinilyticum TaxID=2961570 RepID=UPI0020C56B7A|nr:cytochrome P450 [Natrinema caseinilyticum]